jgi:hypothetical protein
VGGPDETRDRPQAAEGSDAEEEVAPTPFDNPFFLPVVLVGFAIWFVYDGWFNPEMEWIRFNRGGALVTSLLAAYFIWKALRERRAAQEAARSSETSGS